MSLNFASERTNLSFSHTKNTEINKCIFFLNLPFITLSMVVNKNFLKLDYNLKKIRIEYIYFFNFSLEYVIKSKNIFKFKLNKKYSFFFIFSTLEKY